MRDGEIAREIFADIEKVASQKLLYTFKDIYMTESEYAELKKKYIGDEE